MTTERRILGWGVLGFSLFFLLLSLSSGLIALVKLARALKYDPVFKVDPLDMLFVVVAIVFLVLGLPAFIWSFSVLWRGRS